MFVPYELLQKGQYITTKIDITNQRGTFVAPHNFYVERANDEHAELVDIDCNRVILVPQEDMRGNYLESSIVRFENNITDPNLL